MCKIKDQLEQLKENEFIFNLSYEEWLRDNKNILSDFDISKMEKDSLEPLTVSNHILSNLALNNFDFNPKLGA